MLGELRGSAETLPAQPALEGPLVSVDPVVRDEVGTLAEGFAAVAALVGSLPDVVVLLPVANEVCRAAGQRRRKGLCRLMGLEMLTKMHVLDESSAAVDTLVIVLRVRDSHTDAWELRERLPGRLVSERNALTSAEAGHKDQAFSALLTLIGCLLSVDLLVSLKGRLGTEGSLAKFIFVDAGLLGGRLAHHRRGTGANAGSTAFIFIQSVYMHLGGIHSQRTLWWYQKI